MKIWTIFTALSLLLTGCSASDEGSYTDQTITSVISSDPETKQDTSSSQSPSEPSQAERPKPQPSPDEEENASDLPTISASSADPKFEMRPLRVKVVDAQGEPLANMIVRYAMTDPDLLDPMVDSFLTDQSGYVSRPMQTPIADIRMEVENPAIPYSDERRYTQQYLTAEEVAALPEEVVLTWDSISYREAIEECRTVIGFRVLDTNANPIPNANISFYCSYNPLKHNPSDGKFLDDITVLTMGGYTESDGIYLYGFSGDWIDRTNFSYTATAEWEGKSGTGTLTIDGYGKTVIDIVIQ